MTKLECEEAKCSSQKCVQDPDPGLCEALIPKWFFNKTTGVCPFHNHFSTLRRKTDQRFAPVASKSIVANYCYM